MSGRTTNVNNATQLKAAVKVAKGGDTILLAPGDYGSVTINNIRAAGGTVTVQSADATNEASFHTLRMTNLHNFSFVDLDVKHPLAAGEARFSQAIAVVKSSNVSFTGIEMQGSMNGTAWDDGHGLSVIGSERVSILDSTFEQLNNAVTLNKVTDVIVAGNSFTGARQGVTIAQVNNGLFEKNFLIDMDPNYPNGDHPDNFQVLTGGTYEASNNLTFRSNVMIEGTSGFIGGIYIQSERMGQGVRHSDITIDNNFYQGTYRHALSLNGVDNAVITNNTILNSDKSGLSAAIHLKDTHGARVENNITPMLLESRSRAVSDISYANNIDVWEAKTKKGIAVADLFAPIDLQNVDISALVPLAGSVADVAGAGFRPVADIGNLSASFAVSVASYRAQLETLDEITHLV